MNSENPIILSEPDESSAIGSESRRFAIVEVLLAFALVHVLFRSLKEYTPFGRWETERGLNFLPGAVMVVGTLGLLLTFRRDLQAYGLSLSRWADDLKLGLFWTVISAVISVAAAIPLGILARISGKPPSIYLGTVGLMDITAAFMKSAASIALFGYLHHWQRTTLSRVPTLLCVGLYVGILCSPMLVAVGYRQPMIPVLLTVLWKGIFAACGEEMFYRGYVQSRLNEVFGRPWKILEVRLGWGWLLTAALFGFLHALNAVDYFEGRFSFAWGFGAFIMSGALFGGYFRESTGTIWTGVVIHSLILVLGVIPKVMSLV